MDPGDIRETSPRQWGECYMCRRIYRLDDLHPVTGPGWRYICPLCQQVHRRTRLILSHRYLAGERLELDQSSLDAPFLKA